MVEQHSAEVIRKKPLGELIADVFERRVSGAAVKKERRLVMETYGAKFRELVETLPQEKRDTTAIELQKLFIKLRGIFAEYGARFGDFVNNLINWPMLRATPDFPRDKFYQIALARAAAWGGFARNTTKTATAERFGFRDHFLPSAVIGAETGALGLGIASVPFAAAIGAAEGAKIGLAAGAAGVAGGAILGGAIGGLASLAMRLKDRVIGPPVIYYDLFSTLPSSGSSVRAGGRESMGGGGGMDLGSSSTVIA